MTNILNEIEKFVDIAVRNRKYPQNTAVGFHTVLRMVKPELNEEEQNSLDTIKKNLDQIFNTLHSKNPKKWTIVSIEVYKKRLKRLINDYENYGIDTSKISNWDRKPRTIVHKQLEDKPTNNATSKEKDSLLEKTTLSDLIRNEIPVSSEKDIIVFYPRDITIEGIEKAKGFFDYLSKFIVREESNSNGG